MTDAEPWPELPTDLRPLEPGDDAGDQLDHAGDLGLAELFDAAAPADTPGAWIRAAIAAKIAAEDDA